MGGSRVERDRSGSDSAGPQPSSRNRRGAQPRRGGARRAGGRPSPSLAMTLPRPCVSGGPQRAGPWARQAGAGVGAGRGRGTVWRGGRPRGGSRSSRSPARSPPPGRPAPRCRAGRGSAQRRGLVWVKYWSSAGQILATYWVKRVSIKTAGGMHGGIRSKSSAQSRACWRRWQAFRSSREDEATAERRSLARSEALLYQRLCSIRSFA